MADFVVTWCISSNLDFKCFHVFGAGNAEPYAWWKAKVSTGWEEGRHLWPRSLGSFPTNAKKYKKISNPDKTSWNSEMSRLKNKITFFLSGILTSICMGNNVNKVVLRYPPPKISSTKSPVSKPTPGRISWNTVPLAPRRHCSTVLCKQENICVFFPIVLLPRVEQPCKTFVKETIAVFCFWGGGKLYHRRISQNGSLLKSADSWEISPRYSFLRKLSISYGTLLIQVLHTVFFFFFPRRLSRKELARCIIRVLRR